MALSDESLGGTPPAATSGSALVVAVARERRPGERRVALVPAKVAALVDAGLRPTIEAGAGESAGYADEAYATAGAGIVADLRELLPTADLVLCVTCPSREQIELLPRGCSVVGLLQAAANPQLLGLIAGRGVDAYSLELLPRITRAQDMDVLSSMSTCSGYHAAIMAAERLPRFMPLLMTSAGTVRPARLLVIGAGVAGLQAIATARRLGAVVEGFDVRPAAREQVESLGATFVDVGVEAGEVGTGYAQALNHEAQAQEHAVLAGHIAEADAVITTALVAGGAAPRLITREMVEGMRSGSVIVDIAAEAGGNCELTEPGREVDFRGVLICGPTDLPSRMAADASKLFAHNIVRFVLHLVRDGAVRDDLGDEIIGATCVAREGALRGALAGSGQPEVA